MYVYTEIINKHGYGLGEFIVYIYGGFAQGC